MEFGLSLVSVLTGMCRLMEELGTESCLTCQHHAWAVMQPRWSTNTSSKLSRPHVRVKTIILTRSRGLYTDCLGNIVLFKKKCVSVHQIKLFTCQFNSF